MGKFICLAHTRLDIAYVVSVVSQLTGDPRETFLSREQNPSIFEDKSKRGLLFKRNEHNEI